MGNPQHLDWLLEGVEAWNKRREEDDFLPDFANLDIFGSFVKVKKIDDVEMFNLARINFEGADMRNANLQSVNLQGANLEKAILRGANLSLASLENANLYWANLEFANLKGANFMNANLQLSDMREASFKNTILTQAKLSNTSVQSYHYSKEENNSKPTQYTDLSGVVGLEQSQLESMNGDTGVILPKGLIHPDPWPEWDEASPAQAETEGTASIKLDAAEASFSPAPKGSQERKAQLKAVSTAVSVNAATVSISLAAILDLISERIERLEANKPNKSDNLEHWNTDYQFVKELHESLSLITTVIPEQRWSRKIGPVVKMNRPMKRTIGNDEEKTVFERI
ncbi:MAG: pentapeptide repeat-containing protein [Rhodobacteraceae bacterium]|nr:pentapeptide repeat-containing protein [Paracoccaceae bacterium]